MKLPENEFAPKFKPRSVLGNVGNEVKLFVDASSVCKDEQLLIVVGIVVIVKLLLICKVIKPVALVKLGVKTLILFLMSFQFYSFFLNILYK